MKRTALLILFCALLFGIGASWLAPKVITYWYTPPVPSGAASAFNCVDAVNWAMGKLVWTQIIGSAVGAIVGLFLGLSFGSRKAAAAPPAPPPAAPQPPRAG